MAKREGPTAAYRRLLPRLRRAAGQVARAAPLAGEYFTLATPQGDCEIALHRAGRSRAPAVVELHGGGFVTGDVAANDPIREALARGADCAVVGVGYCLAPEHPYPEAADQVGSILDQVVQRAGEWDLDPSRIALMGFSAGANLAVVQALRGKPVAALVLHYPFLDAATDPEDKQPQEWDVPAEIARAFNELYAPPELARSPEISPLFAPLDALAGFPPALVAAAGRDALAPEAEAFARRLAEAGVPSRLIRFPHAAHGYIEQWLGAGQRALALQNQSLDPESEAEAAAALAATIAFLDGVFGAS
jgi:acetyl esterase